MTDGTSVAALERRHFAPLGRDLSRLVLGTMVLSTAELEAGAAVLDEYVRLGGNVIDTARVYGDGESERALGMWLERRRELRDQLVVVSKGAHPEGARKRVTPEDDHQRPARQRRAAARPRRPLPVASRRPVACRWGRSSSASTSTATPA